MIPEIELRDIQPKGSCDVPSSSHIQTGLPIPKTVRVKFFSPDEWESFTEEWASHLKNEYITARRFGGSGDLGIDIAGFCSDEGFQGQWDNYQCKRYDHPLRPSDIWVEIGKIIYYSYLGRYTPPRKHYFVCSQGVGTSFEQLLNKSTVLKEKTIENWDNYCLTGITSTTDIPLTGGLRAYLETFDFTIFSSKSIVELIEIHAQTGFHSVRFGGGLPCRPNPTSPPVIPAENESRYIRQLLDAYGDHLGTNLSDAAALEPHSRFKHDYLRQRERFYHAESLKNFARDTVPAGTFDALQDEIYHGVIDVCEDCHLNGFARMKATITQASTIAVTSNPLVSSIKTQDRQGTCHQLANDNRLNWVPDNE
ncbi:TPA: ABC-three component system protein [Klebsiella oxytoca]